MSIQRPYCQKILPLVYDQSLSYYEVVCKLVDKVNELVAQEGGTPSQPVPVSDNIEFASVKGSSLYYFTQSYKDEPLFIWQEVNGLTVNPAITFIKEGDNYIGFQLISDNQNSDITIFLFCTRGVTEGVV